MKISVLTLFPEYFEPLMTTSILKRAKEKDLFEFETIDFRQFTKEKHGHVDDTPYGGGAGMVLAAQPFVDAYESIEKLSKHLTIMLTPQGEVFDDKMGNDFSQYDQIIMLCGHYEGFDERIKEIIQPKEVSIGDFVLTGGELPALCVIDSVSRKLDGTLGHIESAQNDSFTNGLLEHPQYTKPREYRGLVVPEVLLNGNHAEIEKFRHEKSLEQTKQKRPDLFEKWLNHRRK